MVSDRCGTVTGTRGSYEIRYRAPDGRALQATRHSLAEAKELQASIAADKYRGDWIDPRKGICATIMMQFLPFVDREAVGLLSDFEKAVYANL